MKYEECILNNIKIVGISVRTTNQDGKSQVDIGNLWKDFFTNDVLNKIPNRISDDIYCIYTEYESDYTGMYTTVIGCPVLLATDLPSGFTTTEIEGGRYNKFISEGRMPECVGTTWMGIWKENFERAYKADFDIYGEEAKDPMNAKITTYLSIK